tara:strand:+ start:598 stop:795 length:198 start_codon:yes stop_codon:yes gene_type:complete
MSKGKRYTDEFKKEAVKQVIDRGYSVAEVSERLGICTKTLYQWRTERIAARKKSNFPMIKPRFPD